jgi:ribA/ribD-fused uncharacterized protein
MKRPRSDFYFFWGHPFSQWGLYPMEIEGVTYNCCEQYMMAEKARLFQDAVAEAAIMEAADPATQKAWGRCVRGFDKAAWEAVAREIVYRGNYAKFSQNEAVYLLLMQTGTKTIVEAAADDTIWGIGMDDSHPDICDPSQWRGTNWLGEAIMRVRKELRETGVGPEGATWADHFFEKEP